MEKKKKPGRLFSKPQIFFYILSALIFIFVAYYFTEIKKDIKLFGKINPYWLALAFLGQLCTYLFGAIIYQQLLHVFHIKLRREIWNLFQVSIVTLFFNQTVPSAGISGNAFFFDFLHKRKAPVNHILSLISIELLSFYAAMEIIIVLTVTLSLFLFRIPASFLIVLSAGFLVYLTFGLAVEFLSRKRTISSVYKKIELVKFFRNLVDRFRKSFPANADIENPPQFFIKHKAIVLQAIFLQLCIFFADAITIFALFRGFGVPIIIYLVPVGFILTKIISLLPVSPGALILYEGSMAFFFSKLGVRLGSAAIVTLLYRALSFWLPILLGFVLYRKLQKE